MMGRSKGVSHLISKAGAAREFHLTWDQVDYLFRKFCLQPVITEILDRRCKWYRRQDVTRVMQVAPLKRAS